MKKNSKQSLEISDQPNKNGSWVCCKCNKKFKKVIPIGNNFYCKNCFDKTKDL